MRTVRLKETFQKCTPQLFHRDDVLALKMNQWKTQGRVTFFDTACRLINPLSGLAETVHVALVFFKMYEIFCEDEKLFADLPAKLGTVVVGDEQSGLQVCRKYFGKDRIQQQQQQQRAPVHLVIINSFDSVDLTWNTVAGILDRLSAGGALIVCLGELYHSHAQVLIWVLYQVFREVHICKPKVSNVFDNEKFAVCHGFQPEKKMDLSDWGKILEMCPLPWFSYIAETERVFQQDQEIAQRRAERLTKLLVFHKPFANRHALNKMTNLCLMGANKQKYCLNYLETLGLSALHATT